jgi:hypothetical protein
MCYASSAELYYKLLCSDALLSYFLCMQKLHVLPPITAVKSKLSTSRRLSDTLLGYYPSLNLAGFCLARSSI